MHKKLTEMMLQNNTLTSSLGMGIIFLYCNHSEDLTSTPEIESHYKNKNMSKKIHSYILQFNHQEQLINLQLPTKL